MSAFLNQEPENISDPSLAKFEAFLKQGKAEFQQEKRKQPTKEPKPIAVGQFIRAAYPMRNITSKEIATPDTKTHIGYVQSILSAADGKRFALLNYVSPHTDTIDAKKFGSFEMSKNEAIEIGLKPSAYLIVPTKIAIVPIDEDWIPKYGKDWYPMGEATPEFKKKMDEVLSRSAKRIEMFANCQNYIKTQKTPIHTELSKKTEKEKPSRPILSLKKKKEDYTLH